MFVSTWSGVEVFCVHDPVMLTWKDTFRCLFPPGQVLRFCVHDPVMPAEKATFCRTFSTW